jgi:hypothetical protein
VVIRVLYMDGCAATPATVALIREVAAALGTPISLEQMRIETEAQAVALRFLGSPTVQVNGRDIEPDARASLDFGLT